MSLTLATSMRNAIAAAVTTQLGTTATLEFQTSGDAEVATISLGNPAFGSPSTGVITMTGQPLSDTDASGGTMAKFVIKSGGTTTEISGTVGTSASDINFAAGVGVTIHDTVQLTSLTITCPASA